MDALQFVDVPGYSALILRRTFPDLALPGAIMHRAKQWLVPQTEVRWNDNEKVFTFPSGAQIAFGYLQHEDDKYRYQGTEFHYIAFDELTQFTETQYTYLLSRLRHPPAGVPLRMRGASNPGGLGHDWVKARFLPSIDPVTGDVVYPRDEDGHVRVFVPAKLRDNPSLNADEYERNLRELDPVTRAQLLDGDWGARPPGEMFDRTYAKIINAEDLPTGIRWVRAWDLAGTKKRTAGHDPDYTAGVLMGRDAEDIIYVADVVREQGEPGAVEALVLRTAERDREWPKHRTIRMEQEGGSAGKFTTEQFTKKLIGYDFAAEHPTGPKSERARPFASYWRAGRVRIVSGPWNGPYLSELEAFPQEAAHDDQVDASSLAYSELAGVGQATGGTVTPDRRHNPYHAERRGGLGIRVR